MLADIKNRKSLAFYDSLPEPDGTQMVNSSVNPSVAGNMAAQTGRNVYIYNQEYQTALKSLNLERARLADKVTKGLERDISYRGARGDGVSLAWKYEKADVQMGGTGSSGWNRAERDEIMARGRVGGAEGHHQKNVSGHLEEQANPDNIKFYKSKEEHLQQGHQGKWHNETDAPLIDKNEMLRNTNQKRVVKQELCGLGKATVIGLGIGFSLSFIAEVAKSDFSAEAIESALVKGSIGGIESAAIVAAGYGMGLLTSNLKRQTIGKLFSLKMFILVATIILCILIYRFFCKVMCPLGAIYGLLNKASIYHLEVDKHKCVGCGKCKKICKMDVDPVEKPDSAECIRCGACVHECPKDAIYLGFKTCSRKTVPCKGKDL